MRAQRTWTHFGKRQEKLVELVKGIAINQVRTINAMRPQGKREKSDERKVKLWVGVDVRSKSISIFYHAGSRGKLISERIASELKWFFDPCCRKNITTSRMRHKYNRKKPALSVNYKSYTCTVCMCVHVIRNKRQKRWKKEIIFQIHRPVIDSVGRLSKVKELAKPLGVILPRKLPK